MREINFRAWDKDNKCMIGDSDSEADFKFCAGLATVRYCSEEFYEGGGEIHSRDRWEDCDVEIMQYTGLINKYEQQVWEGDIIQCWIVGTVEERPHIERLRVVFKAGCFYAVNERRSITLSKLCKIQPLNKYYECKVIGNIFENPELLNPTNI